MFTFEINDIHIKNYQISKLISENSINQRQKMLTIQNKHGTKICGRINYTK